MKSIILCAGYATRLYPLTLEKPKSLLPISNKPILNYIIEKVEKLNDIDEIFIVTNDKFFPVFLEWLDDYQSFFNTKIKIINDETKTNDTRLGGIGDLEFAIKKEKINEDLLVILGDNLFDFDLISFSEFFKKINEISIGVYDLKNKEKVKQLGVLEIKNQKLISFEEKPQNPKSTIISTGIYLFPGKDLKKISDYMNTGKPEDGPGYLILNLLKSQDIYAFEFKGRWFDIGMKEIYEEVKNMIF